MTITKHPFTVIIPARYESQRLPGKPLLDIHGLPMILHVYRQAIASGAQQVIIATDHPSIQKVAEAAGAQVCMTNHQHENGTSRLSEVCEQLALPDDTAIINVQGDEPLIPSSIITHLGLILAQDATKQVITLATPILNHSDLTNQNVVKVVLNKNNQALYFSRAPIPWCRDQNFENNKIATMNTFRHIGLYGYKAKILYQYSHLPKSPLEDIEKLEQLRLLWNNIKIDIEITSLNIPHGVDCLQDLMQVRQYLAQH